jgi:hypothetical protein
MPESLEIQFYLHLNRIGWRSIWVGMVKVSLVIRNDLVDPADLPNLRNQGVKKSPVVPLFAGALQETRILILKH